MSCNCSSSSLLYKIGLAQYYFEEILQAVNMLGPWKFDSFDRDNCEWTITKCQIINGGTISHTVSVGCTTPVNCASPDITVQIPNKIVTYPETKTITDDSHSTGIHKPGLYIKLAEALNSCEKSKAEIRAGSPIKPITINRIRDAIRDLIPFIVKTGGTPFAKYDANDLDDTENGNGNGECWQDYVCAQLGISFTHDKTPDPAYCDCDTGQCNDSTKSCGHNVSQGKYFNVKHIDELPEEAAKLMLHRYVVGCRCEGYGSYSVVGGSIMDADEEF